MKLDKNILHIISKYLSRNETTEEREELYQWYDKLEDAHQSIEMEEVHKLQRKGKKRLLAEIKGAASTGNVIKLYRYRLVAACIVVALCCFSLKYFMNRNELIPLKPSELAKIVPDYNKATIRLATGRVINLDSLGNNKAVKIGNTVIRKNKLGQLEYTSVNKNADSHVINTLQTSRSSQYSILLSDGTKVYLNAASQLSYPEKFGAGDRVVELHGEGYFEVKKTLAHSKFIVKTNGQSVEVLGTKFNINAYEDRPSIKTTLAEGSVRVAPINKAIAAILLVPNQQAILNKNSVQRANVDAQKIIRWKDGFFVFDGYNTDEIISEIGKWYGIEIDYKHDKPIEYAGNIPRNINLARLIEILNYSGIKVQAYRTRTKQYKLIIN